MSLPLPEYEFERQSKCFTDKMTDYRDFTEKVKGWLSDVGSTC